jgi:tRNA pseudouridine38-40 synthase
MVRCAPFFLGKHDFYALHRAAPDNNGSTVREISNCTIEQEGPLLTLIVTGGGFLYNMVRIIAGTVLYVGLGKVTPEDIHDIIASKDRARAGKTMPPEGLTLVEVGYE